MPDDPLTALAGSPPPGAAESVEAPLDAPGAAEILLDEVAAAFSAELLLDRDDEAPRLLPFARGGVAAFSRRAPGRTSPNEDSAAILRTGPESGVLVVADGVGGERAGARASALAVETLRAAITEHRGPFDDLRGAILDGIERANTAILALGIGAATTLAVVEVQGAEMRPYHVGDSLILLVGQRGRVKLRAVAHSPVGHAIESGLLDAQEAMNHEERHVVSNLVGTADMRIEVGARRRMALRDTLVVASDGLSDNLTEEEIVARLRCGRPARQLGELVATGRDRMLLPEPASVPSKPDDLTALVYRAGRLFSRDP